MSSKAGAALFWFLMGMAAVITAMEVSGVLAIFA